MDEFSIHEVLARTAVLLDASDNRFLGEFGLNRTQYSALQLLDEREGQRLVDLAAVLLCERSTVTRIIDRLEQLGLAQRHADGADRRSQRVVLTTSGVQLRERVQQLYAESLRESFGVLSAGEQHQLVELLQKLQSGLGAALSR